MSITSRRNPAVGAICFLVAMIEGFDLQAAGVAAPTLGPAFGLSPATMSLFFTTATEGLILGAMVGGRIADQFGRKPGLVAALACFGVFSFATSLSWNVSSLMVFRFMTGFGLGGAMPNLIAIAAESARPGRSSSAVGFMYAGMPTGGGIAAAVSMIGWHAGWAQIFLIGGAAPIIVLPLVLAFLPAIAVVREKAGSGEGRAWRALFEGGRGSTTVLLWIAFFLTLLILYLMLNWLPLLLVKGGIDKASAGLVQVVFNLAGALASVVITPLVDRRGPRGPLAAMFLLMIVALGLFAAAPAGLPLILTGATMIGVALMAAQAILYGLAPAIYAAAVRGTGVGAAVAVGRVGSIVGPLIAGVLVGAGIAPMLLFALLIPFAMLGGTAAVMMARHAGRLRRDPIAAGEV